MHVWGRQYSSASHDPWCPTEVEVTVVLTRIIATAWTLESSHSRWMSKGLLGLSPPQPLSARGCSCLPHRAAVMGEYIHGTKQNILATVIVLFSRSLHSVCPRARGIFLTHALAARLISVLKFVLWPQVPPMSTLDYFTGFGVLSVTDILCPSSFECFPFCLYFLYLLRLSDFCSFSAPLWCPGLGITGSYHSVFPSDEAHQPSDFTLHCWEPNTTRPPGDG